MSMWTEFFHPAENKDKVFTDFYNRNFEYLYSYIFSRTAGDAFSTADIVQEAFMAAYRAMGGFRGLSSEKTWITAIARNKLHDWYRKQLGGRGEQRIESIDAGDREFENSEADDNVEDCVLNNEIRRYVAAALDAINPEYRYVLIMKYLDNASMKEIAALTGRTPKAVDSMLQRARAGFAAAYKRLSKEGTFNG